jgi:uncharacterized protein (TIGR03435 family)
MGVTEVFSKFASSATLWGTTLVLVTGVCAQESTLIEVASVKPSGNTMADSNFDSVRGRLTATNITVRELIRLAYDVKDFQIGQAPRWIDSQRFDISVKSVRTDANSLEDVKQLVRELLAGRFQLTTHRNSKQMAVYLLVVAREGSKLMAHNDAGPRTRGGCGRLVGRRVTAYDVARILSRQVDRAVLDRTGLAGEYDFQLDFTPDSGPCRTASDSPGASSAVDSGLPSLYTAVQQQLGLKLEPSRGPVELLIIDRVEKPSDN